jgi:hypothetical protein
VQFIRTTLLLLAYLIAANPSLRSDEIAKSLVDDYAKSYLLASEFSLPERVQRTIIRVHASPDSELLFESAGEMINVASAVGRYEKVTWSPRILADDRQPKTEHFPVMAMIESWEKIFIEEKEYLLKEGRAEVIDADYVKRQWVPHGRCIDLFDWPILSYESFSRPLATKNLPKVFFGEGQKVRKICLAASRINDETVESWWGVAQKSQVVARLTFRKGLLSKQEFLYFEDPFEAANGIPDHKKSTVFSTVETTWGVVGTEDVPTVVDCTFCPLPMRSKETIKVIAKIEVKDKDSKEYKTLHSKLLTYVDSIRDESTGSSEKERR